MEERTKTEAARLAEQRRAEMVDWLLTTASPEDDVKKTAETTDKSVATAK
jgi:hypothetical protein